MRSKRVTAIKYILEHGSDKKTYLWQYIHIYIYKFEQRNKTEKQTFSNVTCEITCVVYHCKSNLIKNEIVQKLFAME